MCCVGMENKTVISSTYLRPCLCQAKRISSHCNCQHPTYIHIIIIQHLAYVISTNKEYDAVNQNQKVQTQNTSYASCQPPTSFMMQEK